MPDVRPASEGSTSQRNYVLCILNGLFTRLGMNVTHPSMVLSVFARLLGASNTLIGLIPAIRFGGWFLPQFFVASWIQPRPRKVPISVGLETFRMVIYGALAVLTYALGLAHPYTLLIVFFVLFSISRLTTGTSALARLDAIAKVIPAPRRASFFAMRNFFGGILVFGAGFLVRYLLDPDRGLPFPLDFTLLFGLSCVCFVAAGLFFYGIKETPDPAAQTQYSLKAQVVRVPELIGRNATFRRYLLVRVLLDMTRIAAPFYPILALDVLGAPPYMVGFYLSAMTLAEILSNVVWQRVARARSTLHMLKAAGLLTVLSPLVAVMLPWLMQAVGFTVESHGLLPAYLFTGVFLLAGSSQSGRAIGLLSMLLNVASEEERASYIGLANTVLGFVSLLPILSGAVIDRMGFDPVFFAATGLISVGYVAILRWRPEKEVL
jgi:hypothetical protein